MALTHPRDREPVAPDPYIPEKRKQKDEGPVKEAAHYTGEKPHVHVNYSQIEIEKPSGGGRGPNVPYVLSLMINGELALQLTAHSFKKSGQMQQLIDYFADVESYETVQAKANLAKRKGKK